MCYFDMFSILMDIRHALPKSSKIGSLQGKSTAEICRCDSKDYKGNEGHFMKSIIIAIDHGYGRVKTAHGHFQAGVTAYDREPIFTHNMLVYQGKYYIIGEEHKPFLASKIDDPDYYILTLAAIARELKFRDMTTANVHLAVGLPLTWVGQQKQAFKEYLLQNETADFTFNGVEYHVSFADADVFPQGYSAIATQLHSFKGTNMLCDIGNGTMNIMYINNCRPMLGKCFTEKYGTHQCMLAVREAVMREHQVAIDDATIEAVMRFGKADIDEKYLTTIRTAAAKYVEGIMRRLREHEYNPALMRLYIVGGGGCLVKNFGKYDPNRVTINDDICATAKGYEALVLAKLRKEGRNA